MFAGSGHREGERSFIERAFGRSCASVTGTMDVDVAYACG